MSFKLTFKNMFNLLQSIDKTWVKIMNRARLIANVIEVCVGDESMEQLLPHLLDQLESCQKSLSGCVNSSKNMYIYNQHHL